MAEKKPTGEIDDIENDLANLARLAAAESNEDTRLLLARLVRKYRQQRPELAARLDQSLKASQTRSAGNSVLRRGAPVVEPNEAPLPVDGDSRLALIRVFDDREGLAPPILPGSVHDAIGAIIRERQERERLRSGAAAPGALAALPPTGGVARGA